MNRRTLMTQTEKKMTEQYVHLLELLSQKNKESIEHATRKRISFYRNTSEKYFREFTQLCSISDKIEHNIPSLTKIVFGESKSNYTSRLYDKVSSIIPLYQNLEKDLEKPFKLFVMGPGNYGKSTLINSLLGTKEKHAIENIRPMTWKIDIFERNLNVDQVSIVYKNGAVKQYSKADAQILISQEENKTKESKQVVKKKMNEYILNNKLGPKEKKELKLKLERDEVYYSDIVEVRWGIPNAPFLNQFSIVDTPGLNQENFSGEVRNNVQEYYHKSDGVIWLLDATAISAKNSDRLLKDLDESLQEMGGKRATENMIAVLNRIDLVDKIEGQREQVLLDAERIYGDRFNKIVPYSALRAYEGVVKNDIKLMVESGRNDLLDEIKYTFFQDAKTIQCEKKNEACSIYNRDMKTTIEMYQVHLKKDTEKLSEALILANDSLVEETKRLTKEYKSYMNSYIESFAKDLVYNLEHLTTLTNETHKKQYVREVIFKHPTLLNELGAFMEKAHLDISRRTQEIIRENHFTQYKYLDKSYGVTINLPSLSSTKVKTNLNVTMPSIGKFTAYSAGVGLIFGPVGGLIGAGAGAYFSNKARKNTMNSFLNESDRIKHSLWVEYKMFLQRLQKTAENEVTEHLKKSFCELYTIDSEDLARVMDSSKRIQECGTEALQKFEQKNLIFDDPITSLILS